MTAEPGTAPPTPPRDDRDWTWVLHRPCAECGFDAASVAPADVASQVRGTAVAFEWVLRRPGAGQRPQPQVWSPLEYACHVRDVCRVFDTRVALLVGAPGPEFPDWDQDAAALSARYWTQDPAVVSGELTAAAETLARRFEGLDASQWSRPGRRSNGSSFTVESLARYLVHDLVHHRHDVGA